MAETLPNYGDMIGPYDDAYAAATSTEQAKSLDKGDCDKCAYGKGLRYCRRSGYPVKSTKALKSCAPEHFGQGYVPISMR